MSNPVIETIGKYRVRSDGCVYGKWSGELYFDGAWHDDPVAAAIRWAKQAASEDAMDPEDYHQPCNYGI